MITLAIINSGQIWFLLLQAGIPVVWRAADRHKQQLWAGVQGHNNACKGAGSQSHYYACPAANAHNTHQVAHEASLKKQ